jgi:agmatine deiminase
MTGAGIPHPPAELGYHMPAEWDRHEATWIAWPHNRSDWPGKIVPVYWAYAEIVRILSRSEIVRILVTDRSHEARVRGILSRSGADMARVQFFIFPTNRGWARDYGPIFVRRGKPQPGVGIVNFHFNAWAKYTDWEKDDAVAAAMGERLGVPVFGAMAAGRPFVCEGGAIDVNGAGTLITTEECLLDPRTQTRNPGLGRHETERALRALLGVERVLWLGRGLTGDDDTHGHVDDLCRFVRRDTVVLCREHRASDPNHDVLEENRERLEDMRLHDGARIEVVHLPMPEPVFFDGRRLPASYANFYIANTTVLVPTFNDPADRVALGILADLFPHRTVCGVHAVDLVWGLGTLHCLTQQQPAL